MYKLFRSSSLNAAPDFVPSTNNCFQYTADVLEKLQFPSIENSALSSV